MTEPHAGVPQPALLVGAGTGQSGEAYRFDSFRTGLLIDDMRFRRTDPGPGDPVPAFDLPTLDGGRFRGDDLGNRPVLVIFGSRTCPVTESAGPRLARLHHAFARDVRFVFVNTREAHPGERIPQPETFDEKWAHAPLVRDHHRFGFDVAVDDIDGSLHRYFSPKPNSAYLLLRTPPSRTEPIGPTTTPPYATRSSLSATAASPGVTEAAPCCGRCCERWDTCRASFEPAAARSNGTCGVLPRRSRSSHGSPSSCAHCRSTSGVPSRRPASRSSLVFSLPPSGLP
jgi:thiol-disulfide isomerase/thioredoxin